MIRRGRRIKVSVVVPAHNEQDNIEKLLAEFNNVFRDCNFSAEVIMVDDGSTDKTAAAISAGRRRHSFVRVVRHRTRQGLTTALTTGFATARGDILIFYPADLQFHPRDIPRMVERIDNGADMVCGKKVGQYGKWLVSWFYNLLTRILFPTLKVSDLNSVKAFTREVYNSFPTMREGWHRYLAVFAAARGFAVREVPVKLHKRHSGESKFKKKGRIIKGLTDLIAVKFQVSVLGDPMHLFGKLSLALFFTGLVVLAVAAYYRFVLEQGYRPILYVVLMFEISALLTFVLGIVTESLVYLRDSIEEMRAENRALTDKVKRLSPRHTATTAEPRKPEVNGKSDSRQPRRSRPRRSPQRRQSSDESRQEEIKLRELPNEQKASVKNKDGD